MMYEETQCRHSDQSVLFLLVRKWLQIRGCYPRTMILRIVGGRRNVGSILANVKQKPKEAIHLWNGNFAPCSSFAA